MSDGPIRKESLSEKVFHRIRDWIRDNDVREGERLPTEDYFCKAYSVSRTTVREAVRMLKSLRYVETYPGRGTFVVNPDGDVSGRPGYWFLENEAEIVEALEARIAIEVGASKLAAERATAEDLTKLSQLADEFEQATKHKAPELMTKADIAFHREIMRISGNRILGDLHGNVMKALDGFFQGVFGLEGIPAISTKGHRKIIEAMKSGNGERTGRAMEAHIQTSLENVDRIEHTLRRIQEQGDSTAP